MKAWRSWRALVAVTLSGCVQSGISPAGPAPQHRAVSPLVFGGVRLTKKIQHVIIIFQENRSVDNLFNGLPGADTVRVGENTAGEQIPLMPVSLTAPYDPDHSHVAFETEYNSGAMNGFNLEQTECYTHGDGCGVESTRVYGYVPQIEVQPYFDMAENYAFADRMFQTQQGPSFPAHQYIISGTSTITEGSELRASAQALAPSQKVVGGCDSPTGSLALTINERGAESKQVFPCFERPALSDLVDAAGLTWHYYISRLGHDLWNGPDAIHHIRYSSEYSQDVVKPSSRVLADIAKGKLANVVWVTPPPEASDHAHITNGSGPSWVASIVNAIGESSYWENTAIFVTWDDWGGWYDHVPPQAYNSYELGFRVPLIVISAYTPKGYVSHKQHEFGSILKFVERTFGLGSLGTTDVRSDDLRDCFDFNKPPRKFTKIPAPLNAQYFLKQPSSNLDVDDDY